MGIDIRLPNITGATEKERLRQMESYLFQFVEQLNWALQNVDTATVAIATPKAKSLEAAGGGVASDPQSTFSSIKSLIIKSAEIVDAYYEEISKKLQSLYVAQSDFGTYVEETSAVISANSTSITQNYEHFQGIFDEHDISIDSVNRDLQAAKANVSENVQGVRESVTGVNALLEDAKAQLQGSIDDLEVYITGLQDAIIGVSAYIKTGLLSSTDASIPIYGIEVGQTVGDSFRKYARFCSEKLSFYDANDIEVAYISDKKLHIRMAHITVALQVGGLIGLVMESGDVVEKWVGIGG